MSMWREYVPVHLRRQRALKEMDNLRKKGKKVEPIVINGNKIAVEFWGKKWCDHFEGYADYSNRLPRGRTYVRNGSVCHLSIQQGQVEAMVSGSELYTVTIQIRTLAKDRWEAVKRKCTGFVGSILELLQGKVSKHVMQVVSDSKEGLFPHPKEISYQCSCPDWAGMCKHVAAVLYGIGSRLDNVPELLFQLRGVDPQELVANQINLASESKTNVLESDNLAELFGIDMDEPEQPLRATKQSDKKKTAPKTSKATRIKKQTVQLNPDTLTGKDLREFRAFKKMTVADLADALEVTPASVYRWENSTDVLKLQSRSKKSLMNMIKLDPLFHISL
jgi:uncharacterized Zn finger protein